MPTQSAHSLIAYSLLALGLVMTPGPNMVYLISRTLCQGRRAGFTSYAGLVVGSLIYLLMSALGLTALLLAVPLAYDALRFGGAIYLGYLAWQAIRPGGRSPFEARQLPPDSPRRLFLMGLFTNLLNPKQALFYLALLPQFIDAGQGHVMTQFLMLGGIQILISMIGSSAIMWSAGSVATFLSARPGWLVTQRWFMGFALAGLSVRMAFSPRN